MDVAEDKMADLESDQKAYEGIVDDDDEMSPVRDFSSVTPKLLTNTLKSPRNHVYSNLN